MASFLATLFSESEDTILWETIEITTTDVEVEDSPSNTASTTTPSLKSQSAEKTTPIEEEIDIKDTLLMEKKSPQILKTLLTGVPSPTSPFFSFATMLINVLLLLAVTDLIFRAKVFHPSNDLSFARVGYVSSSGAKLLIREPDQSKMPINVHFRIHNPKPPL